MGREDRRGEREDGREERGVERMREGRRGERRRKRIKRTERGGQKDRGEKERKEDRWSSQLHKVKSSCFRSQLSWIEIDQDFWEQRGHRIFTW